MKASELRDKLTELIVECGDDIQMESLCDND